MVTLTLAINSAEGLHTFECYPADEPINIGEPYLRFFGGIADVTVCYTEIERLEINKHDRPSKGPGDLAHNFWRACYKIKSSSTFDLTKLDYSLVEKTYTKEEVQDLCTKAFIAGVSCVDEENVYFIADKSDPDISTFVKSELELWLNTNLKFK